MLQKFNERNRDLVVNINGKLVHRDEAGVSPFDSAVQGGDAVWEGLRLYDGRIFALEEHLARLRSSALALAFEDIPSNENITEEIRRTLAANKMRDGVHIRLTLTRGVKVTSGMDPRLNQSGPTLIVLAEHKAPVYSKAGLTLFTSTMRRPSPDVLDPKIHHANLLNSVLAKIQANAAGADDAIMLTAGGAVAECAVWGLFWWEGRRLCAPALELGVLPGVARARLEEMTGGLAERRARLEDLEGRSLFVANAARGIVPVAGLEGRKVPQDSGTSRLSGSFWP
jgi:branched-chain amino acid aminotransferase